MSSLFLVVQLLFACFITFIPYVFGVYSILYSLFRLRRPEDPSSARSAASSPSSPLSASPSPSSPSTSASSPLNASTAPLNALPGVSILKPVKGAEWNLRRNLRSFFVLDYPRYEVIFCFASEDDAGLPIAREVMKEFPQVAARITVGESNVGVNPKVNNIFNAYHTMAYDYMWLSDSNVYAEPGTLVRAMQKMVADPSIGLAHQVPVGVDADSFGADLETMYYATGHARMYTFISGTDCATCVMGKSMLFRKSDLERAGGLKPIGQFMCEDNRIGEELHWIGKRHVLMDDVLTQPLGKSSALDYIHRRIRWIRLRWSMGYLGVKGQIALTLEPIVECVPNALMSAALWWAFLGLHPVTVAVAQMCCWFVMDVAQTIALQKKPIDDWLRHIKTWAVREVLYIPMFVYAISGRTFDWRGKVYVIREDGTGQLLDAADDHAPSAPTSPDLKGSSAYSFEKHGLITIVGLVLGALGIMQFAQMQTYSSA